MAAPIIKFCEELRRLQGPQKQELAAGQYKRLQYFSMCLADTSIVLVAFMVQGLLEGQPVAVSCKTAIHTKACFPAVVVCVHLQGNAQNLEHAPSQEKFSGSRRAHRAPRMLLRSKPFPLLVHAQNLLSYRDAKRGQS